MDRSRLPPKKAVKITFLKNAARRSSSAAAVVYFQKVKAVVDSYLTQNQKSEKDDMLH